MNREIKFRAFENGKMYSKILTAGYILENFKLVMQYIGRKDVEGKEIYEGDIVAKTLTSEKYKIIYSGCSFKCESIKSKNVKPYPFSERVKCIVLGNIHENPELLNN